MLIVVFVFSGFLVTVHSSSVFKSTEACVTVSKHCPAYTINCTEGMIMVTRILFETTNNGRHDCMECLDTLHGQTNDITDSTYGGYTNNILQTCSFQHSCELRHYERDPPKIGIRYKCISGPIITDPCGGTLNVLNNGDQHHIVLMRSSKNGTCRCVINGSTELTVQDYFTRVCHGIKADCTLSNSVLLLNNLAFSNGTNIVHSGISYANVSNITIHFDQIFQRLWLSVNVTENGTRMWCTDSDSSTHSTTSSVVTSGVTSTSAYSTTTLTDPNLITNATTISTNAPDAIVTSAAVATEPTSQSLPFSTSTGTYPDTSGYLNTTYEKAKTSISVIMYVAPVSSVVVIALIVVGSIVVIRYKRSNKSLQSTNISANNANRVRRRSCDENLGYGNKAMQDNVNNLHDYQTVSHIPLITNGRVEYAVAVPPSTYNYALTQYDEDASQKFRSKAEQTGSSNLDDKLANAAECNGNPYFILCPFNEQSFGATMEDLGTEDTVIRADDGDAVVALNDTDNIRNVYNHTTLGRGPIENESEINSDVICSDDYSHISIDDNKASGKGRYYNIVNINVARAGPDDNYCQIGPNSANVQAHVPEDDYNHVVL